MRFTIRKSVAQEPSRVDAADTGRLPSMASPARLRAIAQAGYGEQFAMQHALARMERTTTDTAPVERHVVTIEDTTRGLGLPAEDAGKIHRLIQDTPVEFTPKTQVHRLFLAKSRLVDAMRALDVPSDARMEIARRAGAWWRKSFETELIRRRSPESIRFKSAAHQKLVVTPPRSRRRSLEW